MNENTNPGTIDAMFSNDIFLTIYFFRDMVITNLLRKNLKFRSKKKQDLIEMYSCKHCVEMTWVLTDEGKSVIENGSHEAIELQNIPPDGMLLADLILKIDRFTYYEAIKYKWIRLDKKAQYGARIYKRIERIPDIIQHNCVLIGNGSSYFSEEDLYKYKVKNLIKLV